MFLSFRALFIALFTFPVGSEHVAALRGQLTGTA
jgi:hypothetical protein